MNTPERKFGQLFDFSISQLYAFDGGLNLLLKFSNLTILLIFKTVMISFWYSFDSVVGFKDKTSIL